VIAPYSPVQTLRTCVKPGTKRFERRAISGLLCIARFRIRKGKLDEFKQLAAKCLELVRTKDAGILQYKQYLNSDNTECLVFARYRDSRALLDHRKNRGDRLSAILRTCSGSGEICGSPRPELIELLKDSPEKNFYANWSRQGRFALRRDV
jgi:quinol monooxygenase YgiN